MRINEIIAENVEETVEEVVEETIQTEASYEGNLGFAEVMEFFNMAEKKDPALVKQVEELIESNQDSQAWKVIQEFLGVELQGAEFSVDEDGNFVEGDAKAEKILQLRRDFQKLQMSPGMGGKEMAEIMKARKAKLKAQIAAIQAGKDPDEKKPAPRPPVKKTPPGRNPDGSYSVEGVKETATAGGTSAGNIASIPVGQIPKDQKAWAGKPGKMGKSPKPVTAKPQKPTDNAINKDANLFSGEPIKRK